jgi:4-hydroxy-3-methylbut-2-en-1-yl diphosphate reductase
MVVRRARTAGFCMGVDLALRKLDKLLAERADSVPLYTFGPLIHNPQVIQDYARQGVRESENPGNIEPGSIVLIRAHGIPRPIYQRLLDRGVTIVDATCPKVMRAQKLIAQQAARGGALLLYGEANHPEVRGLLSHAPKDAMVFENLDELRAAALDPGRSYFLAAQTTQDEAGFQLVQEYAFAAIGKEIPVLTTICDATMKRQQEALAIAKTVDFMVVVGGFNSGNTRRLVKVVQAAGVPCIQVETPGEILTETFRESGSIGLTAGASTPKTIIDAVEALLNTL